MLELNKEYAYDLKDLNDEQIKQVAEFVFNNRHKNQNVPDIGGVITVMNECKEEDLLSFYKDEDDDELWGFSEYDLKGRNLSKPSINALTLFEIQDSQGVNKFIYKALFFILVLCLLYSGCYLIFNGYPTSGVFTVILNMIILNNLERNEL